MQKILQQFLPFDLSNKMKDQEVYDLYKTWDEPARQTQISAITFLTALLYIFFSFLDKSWASDEAQRMMLKVHLLGVVPCLLAISFLAYKKRFYSIVMPLLTAYPIFSMGSHAYIASHLENVNPFLTEGHLGVFWIFVISGMTLKNAFISASLSSLILTVSGFYIINDSHVYAMHVFWVLCSFSFGFLGAFLFDRSRKEVFLSQEKLHVQAITDELTGVFNRNHLNTIISHEIDRDLRYDKSFGLLIIDIDHFKKINDTYGHTVGDEVLQKVAQVLSVFIRSNDTLVRWGGEEFVVVAIEVDDSALNDLCEKLRQKIEDEIYGVAGQVTVSIGAALFRKNDTQDSLLLRADKALYEAKEGGRNRTVSIS